MWEAKPKNLNEGTDYYVMDGQRFIHGATYTGTAFVNKVTKLEIKNVVRVWN